MKQYFQADSSFVGREREIRPAPSSGQTSNLPLRTYGDFTGCKIQLKFGVEYQWQSEFGPNYQ